MAPSARTKAPWLLGVDQFGAGRDHAALDQFGERDARRVARGHEWGKSSCRQRLDGGDARFRRGRIGMVAFEADVAAAETFCHGAVVPVPLNGSITRSPGLTMTTARAPAGLPASGSDGPSCHQRL